MNVGESLNGFLWLWFNEMNLGDLCSLLPALSRSLELAMKSPRQIGCFNSRKIDTAQITPKAIQNEPI